MQADSWSATVQRVLADANVVANAETMVRSPGSTIVPHRDGSAARISRWLADLATSTRGDIDDKLRIEGLLGEGGMGVVRIAEQRSLGRKVALKTLKAGVNDDAAIEKVLHEAIITGHVEHPSVVPIHDIVVDAQGRPAIVLKRIEGQPWEALMFDARAVERRFGATDLLEWNLQTLAQVANAIAFAHTRGIVHRDLKPENVMVGEFGEIYVVDWGLAVAVDPEVDPRLPRLLEIEPMAGTPCYMAPEMLGGVGATISRATDVYLLGAILYEVVYGMPPHRGSTFEEIVQSIVQSDPPFVGEAPMELVAIMRRALDADPHARFENAVQLRHALLAFLKHQGSRRLAEEASLRRVRIESTIEAHEQGEKIDDATLQATYVEARFGYQQALRAWPENTGASAALRELVVRVVEYELARGEPRVAATILAGNEDELPQLTRRVELAMRAKDAEHAKLEALSRALDPETGRKTRTFITAIIGTMWTVTPQMRRLPYLRDIPEVDALVLLPMAYLGIGTLLLLWARESMTKTAINRFLAAFVGLMLFCEILLSYASRSFGHSAVDVYRLNFPLWALAAGTVAMVTQWRMFVSALGYIAGFFYLMKVPEDRYLIASLCNGLTTLIAVFIWLPGEGPARFLDRLSPKRGESLIDVHVARSRDHKLP